MTVNMRMNAPQEMLANAIMLASVKHNGQFDKGGAPYILHPLKVMNYLKSDDAELMAIAVLHDVVEDTDVTYYDLRYKYGMSVRILEGVRALTKIKGETPDEYLQKVLRNKDACRVKLCDLHHNCDVRRLKGVTEKDIQRIEKYHNMYLKIKAHLEAED